MTVDVATLDAHEQPSNHVRAIWKAYSKTDGKDLLRDADIDDLSVPEKLAEFQVAGSIPVEKIQTAFSRLTGDDPPIAQLKQDSIIYYYPLLPGLLIILNLMLISIQKSLITRLIYRNLS